MRSSRILLLAVRESARYKGRMENLPSPQDFEKLAIDAGISVAEACRRARVHPSVFQRWRAGKSSPRFEAIAQIKRELDAAIENKS